MSIRAALHWQSKFEPVARALNHLSADFEKEHGRPATLERRGPMQQTARNAYVVRYSLQQSNDAQLSLTFMVVGEDADLVLMEESEASGARDLRADLGKVDQRVYRLEKIDEIKAAVREKITAHLQARKAQQ